MLALLDKALFVLGLVLSFIARDKRLREQALHQDTMERIEDDPGHAMHDHFNSGQQRQDRS